MAATIDPVQMTFETAIREFKKKLRDDTAYSQLLQTTNINQVYDMTDKLQDEQAKKGHMRHLGKISPFLERLRDYTSTIETFTQAKPEILALIWGPVKLLLQWTSVLKQSFDQLVTTIADIGDLLPEFKKVSELFCQNGHIKDVLALFFQDMLDIYVIALNFFNLSRKYCKVLCSTKVTAKKTDKWCRRLESCIRNDVAKTASQNTDCDGANQATYLSYEE